MCTRPIERDGNTFACRSCDACIATRRHQWVARAMMEKAEWPHCLVVALTYGSDTQSSRDAAAMFQYQDIRLWLARVRKAANAVQAGARIRFLVAGEQGDRYGRCHWHAILFSDVDPTSLGTVQGFKKGHKGKCVLTDKGDMLTVGKQEKRLDWSLWTDGFVTFQEADQGGMSYVLSYVLKDQFTHEKSKDTMREAKAENFATGLFRMSKRPAIGESFLFKKLVALEQKGAVLPSLNLKVPGFHGFYQPSGSFREKLLWGLVALNQRVVWSTGADAPQWASLLASCSENETDLEVLRGPQIEHPDESEDWEYSLAKRQREAAGGYARKQFARECGGHLPCQACLDRLSDEELSAHGVQRRCEGGFYYLVASEGCESIETRQRRFRGRSHPLCQKRGTVLSRVTFPDSDRTRLAADLQGKAGTH